jgi:hypothetical protein
MSRTAGQEIRAGVSAIAVVSGGQAGNVRTCHDANRDGGVKIGSGTGIRRPCRIAGSVGVVVRVLIFRSRGVSIVRQEAGWGVVSALRHDIQNVERWAIGPEA